MSRLALSVANFDIADIGETVCYIVENKIKPICQIDETLFLPLLFLSPVLQDCIIQRPEAGFIDPALDVVAGVIRPL